MTQASDIQILIVDDEPDVRELLSACFEFAEFNVETAENGIDAIDKIHNNTPDLIILDKHMPRQSAIRFMGTLQENKKWVDISIIVIAAHARNQFGYVEINEDVPFVPGSSSGEVKAKVVTPTKLVKAVGNILEINVDILEDENS